MNKKLPLIGIIDDDKIYQFLLTRIINRNNLAQRIITFGDGEEAIQYLEDHKADNEKIPDVIFLDAHMPIMDGWTFIAEYAHIKTEFKKNVAVFMLSSSVNPLDIERAGRISEISNYIVKPIKLEEVKMIFNDFKIS
jgi:CheY-like chemotaxis protein